MSYYKMHRGWMDNKVFQRDRYCRRAAWAWLIENAVWQDTKYLKRGQLSHSIRHLAQVWKWSIPAVTRLLRRLEADTMIVTATDTGQTVITICNYDRYQALPEQPVTPPDTPTVTTPEHNRNGPVTIEKKEEGRRKNNNNSLPSGGGSPKPTRLSKDWILPHAWKQWALDARPDVDPDAEAAKFRDHWIGAPKGTKLDWEATWRNWIRRSDASRRTANDRVERSRDSLAAYAEKHGLFDGNEPGEDEGTPEAGRWTDAEILEHPRAKGRMV